LFLAMYLSLMAVISGSCNSKKCSSIRYVELHLSSLPFTEQMQHLNALKLRAWYSARHTPVPERTYSVIHRTNI
jgi:hypothetical protein